jgi:hypothetical protein
LPSREHKRAITGETHVQIGSKGDSANENSLEMLNDRRIWCRVRSVYADGTNVKQDYIQAYKWLILSLAGSTDNNSPTFQKATDLRDSICKKMTSQQIEEAEQLAREWESRYVQRMGNGPFVADWGVITPVASVRPIPPTQTKHARNASVVQSAFNALSTKTGLWASARL